MRSLYLFFLFQFLIIKTFQAQNINGYAKVIAINATKTVLTVSTSNEAAGATATFTAGMEILIMQMQDSTIGNVTNTPLFGDIGNIRNAGKFEYNVVASVTRPSGVLTTITLSSALTGTFRLGINATVQIVTFPILGSPDFTTTGNITGLPWNGDIGGVINFKVNGDLTLGHLIDARGLGFRGGSLNANNGSGCENNIYFSAPNAKYAGKGEGIYKNTNVNFNIAIGRLMNGGGGGIVHNGGGGGGGNFSTGGNGGVGYNTGGCTGSAGGIGGVGLAGFINSSRLFLGGGAGAGQQNNSVGSAGGNGGGIIFIKADSIKSGIGCGVLIDASGNPGLNLTGGGNDGAGGGGGGGTVYLDALGFNIDVSCPLNIKADGGSGGNSLSTTQHAGGGGGGQGVIIFATARPTTNVISTTLNGVGGTDNSGGTKSSTNGIGTSNTGIFQNLGPLPIELLYFNAEKQNGKVALNWATASEKNNKKFTIYRSKNLQNWEAIASLNGRMNSTSQIDYQIYDYAPNKGLNYYLLEQEDINGTKEKFNVQVVEFLQNVNSKIKAYPNPSNGNSELYLENINDADIENLRIVNIAGKIMPKVISNKDRDLYVLKIDSYVKGVYLVYLQGKSFKFVVSE